MRYALILNPAATGLEEDSNQISIENLQSALLERGHSLSIFRVSPGEDIKELSRKIVSDGFDRIIAAGGDGTVGGAANGILSSGSSVPMGIIPLGLGNDFARNNGILGWNEAFPAVLGDNQVYLDVGLINGKYFLNSASFGFDARIVEEVHYLRRKSKLRILAKLFAYFFIFLRELITPKYFWFKTADSERFQKGLLIAMLNGPSYGKIFRIMPQADMADGLLDIYVLKYETRWKAASDILRFFIGARPRSSSGELLRVKEFFLETSGDVKTQVDGEPLGGKEYFYKILLLPKKLIILKP